MLGFRKENNDPKTKNSKLKTMSLIAILLGLLPGFAWLFFYLQEDLHAEPKRLIARTFLFGAAAAVFALAAEIVLNAQFGLARAGKFAFGSFLVFALVEETAKFVAAYRSIHKHPAFDEPVDAMIYLVIAALGFATVENLGAAAGAVAGRGALLASVFATTTIRFVGATLLHTLASAIVGYFWAQGIRRFGTRIYIVIGLAAATVLHAAFNLLIITFESIVQAILLLVVAGFFILGDFEKLKNKTV